MNKIRISFLMLMLFTVSERTFSASAQGEAPDPVNTDMSLVQAYENLKENIQHIDGWEDLLKNLTKENLNKIRNKIVMKIAVDKCIEPDVYDLVFNDARHNALSKEDKDAIYQKVKSDSKLAIDDYYFEDSQRKFAKAIKERLAFVNDRAALFNKAAKLLSALSHDDLQKLKEEKSGDAASATASAFGGSAAASGSSSYEDTVAAERERVRAYHAWMDARAQQVNAMLGRCSAPMGHLLQKRLRNELGLEDEELLNSMERAIAENGHFFVGEYALNAEALGFNRFKWDVEALRAFLNYIKDAERRRAQDLEIEQKLQELRSKMARLQTE